ncbi:MAG: SulP family inorganic anion transporter [Myxococcota bacterium]
MQTDSVVKEKPVAKNVAPPPAQPASATPKPDAPDLRPTANIKYDLPAGLVVFLVALPLCLGIALASNAPLFSGVIAGIVGGLVVPFISGSPLSVSGPAAGLAAIVSMGIAQVGGFPQFLAAVLLGGVIQILLGAFRLGAVAYFIPSSVIKGMLTAIGLLLIFKQLPHAIGYDVDNFASVKFKAADGNTFSVLLDSVKTMEWGAFLISAVSLVILAGWEHTPLKKISFLPSALVAVVVGSLINEGLVSSGSALALGSTHLVDLPPMDGVGGFVAQLQMPQWSAFTNPQVWVMGLTLGIVASLETLLSIEAVDKLDPFHRKSPLNRELLAQGAANATSGLIGGLPITAVIVRSSANVNAGARTQASAIFHGVFLFLAVVFAGSLLVHIPLACLASILLMTGYKLAKPAMFRAMFQLGWGQFIPFMATIVAIVFTDLLRGIGVGLVVGLAFVIRANIRDAFTVKKHGSSYLILLRKDVFFYNKAVLIQALERIPSGASVIVDGGSTEFIDMDIYEAVLAFKAGAAARNINVELRLRAPGVMAPAAH